jgi:NAD(P)-dependent dehydrogenase (short-subunit alcohol dehydrogenase family)
MPDERDLQGRVAIVTGGSSGIGRATAVALARRGASVMAVGRNRDRLASVAREAERITPLAESVATPEGCARIVEETRRSVGPISILVNGAGLGGYLDRPIWEQRTEIWRETMAVNLDAPFELTRLAVSDMVEQRWGRIVMVSSTAGQVGAPSMSSYCASKQGLLGLTRSIAQDVARFNVTCNAVLPGWVRGTDMAERDAEEEAARRSISVEDVWAEREASYPAGRVLTPEEVARVIVFLSGEAASGVSGEAITVALGSHW